jgi:hypothetical protein
MVMINVGYGGYIPGGTLGDRFGYTSQVGGEVGYKFKNNLYASLGGQFLFGDVVKEGDFLKSIRLSNGYIMGADGRYATIRYYERGYAIPLRIGYIFNKLSLFKTNPNSGVYIESGIQFIQHKIRIEVIGNNVPALDNNYKKGYDRLTNGLGLLGSVGYRFFGNKRLVNFYLALDMSANFTAERRDYNFDLLGKNDQQRTDILTGFRAGWTLPLYPSAPEKKYFY